jgi:uncharacterized membrane protein YjgN (DUF898 family)
MGTGGPDKTAVEFEGDLHAFIPIALTNVILNIVTLGFYRFWATTRERRYFWSQTRFIDDQLEWTGTGLELFIGFVIALFLIGAPFLVLNLVAQGAILQGQPIIAGILGIGSYIVLLCLVGFAIFRGLRYRLSRTSWHGIHGGSDNPGFKYGWSYIWKSLAGLLPLGLLVPWSSTSLWKERWESMSFGPHQFEANPQWQGLMKRYLLCYLIPLVLVVIAVVTGFSSGGGGAAPSGGSIALLIFGGLMYMIGLPLLALAYYAAYLREVAGTLRLSTLQFEFKARTLDWILLFLGNMGLAILAYIVGFILLALFGGGMAALGTLQSVQMGEVSPIAGGVSIIILALCFIIPFMLIGPFVRYRTWVFFIRHFEVGGEVNLSSLTQSTTAALKQGEGLLDAFDVGAI